MKRKAVICDLDNTLTDSNHRSHLVSGSGRRDWDKFFALALQDKMNQWCFELMKIFESQGFEIIFVTGRPSKCLKDTMEWIHRETHFKVSMGHNLFMRPEGDRREDTIIKEEIYKKFIEPNYEVFMAIDDKPSIINMWRKNGIPALHCGDLKDK